MLPPLLLQGHGIYITMCASLLASQHSNATLCVGIIFLLEIITSRQLIFRASLWEMMTLLPFVDPVQKADSDVAPGEEHSRFLCLRRTHCRFPASRV
jgi:hypothetical protein